MPAAGEPVELRRPRPRALYPWLRRASWVESAVFAGLLFFWLAPGFEAQTTVFGWTHGIGYLALVLFIFVAVVRHEVPFWLLAVTFTPLGPIATAAGIVFLDRRTKRMQRVKDGADGVVGGRGSTQPASTPARR